MTRADKKLRQLQWDCYLMTHRLLRTMEQELVERFRALGHRDMSIARVQVLTLLLQNKEPSTAQQLAQQMGLSPVTVGRFVRALEQGDWVARTVDPADGRAYLLEPTAKARANLSQFLEISDELLDRAYEGIDKSELDSWRGHLDRIVATLDPAE